MQKTKWKLIIILSLILLVSPIFANATIIQDNTGWTLGGTQSLPYYMGIIVRPNYDISLGTIFLKNGISATDCRIFSCPSYINGSVWSNCSIVAVRNISTTQANFSGINLSAGGYYLFAIGDGTNNYIAKRQDGSCGFPLGLTNVNITSSASTNYLGTESALQAGDVCFNFLAIESEVYSPVSNFTFWNFVNQIPSDLTSTTYGLLTIKYNTSQILNTSLPIYLNYTITNSTTYINNTLQESYQTKNSSNQSNYWQTLLNDNNYFPAVYNIDESVMESTQKTGYFTLNPNYYASISFINVRNDTQYNIFEVMMNTSSNGLAEIYYCNDNYINGDVSLSSNCVLFSTFNGTGFNHTHNPSLNYSSHNVFSLPIINGKVGNVNVTNTSYFIIKGISGSVYVYYNNLTSPRPDAFMTSNNNGATYTTHLNNFIDSHLHQFFGTSYFQYQQCGSNITSDFNCSSFQSDNLQITNLPPTSPQIYSPNNQDYSYNNSILLNFSDAIPSNINTTRILFYNYTLINSTGSETRFFSDFGGVVNSSSVSAADSTVLFYLYPNDYITGIYFRAISTSAPLSYYVSFCTISNCYNSINYNYGDFGGVTLQYNPYYALNSVPNENITMVIVYFTQEDEGGTSTATNLTSLKKYFTPQINTTGNYYIKITAQDNNSLTSIGVSKNFNITSNINFRLQDNFSSNYVSDFTGWIYNTDTGWNQSFTANGSIITLNIYNGLNEVFISHPSYSITSNNFYNFTINSTPQTVNYTFNLFTTNSVYVSVYDADTDLFINDNSSVIVLRSGNYYNTSNTTNGIILFSDLPPDNYILSVSHIGYATSSYSLVVYNLSSQVVKARISTSNTSIGFYVKNQLYQGIEGVLITQQRQRQGGSWITINQVFSDVNGFSNIAVQEGLIYRFILTSDGYVTRQFELAMYSVLSPYTFVILPTTTNLYTNYWAGVNYYYSPTITFLNQSVYNFSITTYNSSLDIAWTSVLVNGTRVNVTGSPAGATASINMDLTNFKGALPVVYSFYFYNPEFDAYFEFKIPITYYVNSLSVTQTSMPEVWSNFKDDIQTGSPTGQVWTTIIAMFLILAIVITMIQISGNQVLGLVGGVAGLGFFAYVGWLNPIFAIITGLLAGILLFMNRG